MDIIHRLLGSDIEAGLLVILNLVVIESLLSIDNAAVLATMVMDLPREQRKKALRYGVVGAYVFRGICLFIASWLVHVWFLKPLGGIYLLYLSIKFFRDKARAKKAGAGGPVNKRKNALYRFVVDAIGNFWATVVLVEVMDIAFSIDNVFAAVAFTKNMFLVYSGVFMGMLAMRFVAQVFVRLISRFPFLETIAFIVIGVLGIKLSVSLYTHFYHDTVVGRIVEGEGADMYVSVFTMAVFLLPVVTSLLFNFPRRHKNEPVDDKSAEVFSGKE